MCYNHQINFYEELPVGFKAGSEKKNERTVLGATKLVPHRIF